MSFNSVQSFPNSRRFLFVFNRIINSIGFEAVSWITGVLFLAFFNPPGQIHFTICPLANLGIDFCPGCGLGNSISYILKGNLNASFAAHPLGAFALIIILFRIVSLIKFNRRRNG